MPVRRAWSQRACRGPIDACFRLATLPRTDSSDGFSARPRGCSPYRSSRRRRHTFHACDRRATVRLNRRKPHVRHGLQVMQRGGVITGLEHGRPDFTNLWPQPVGERAGAVVQIPVKALGAGPPEPVRMNASSVSRSAPLSRMMYFLTAFSDMIRFSPTFATLLESQGPISESGTWGTSLVDQLSPEA
jgi:hypothetical protein